MDIQHTTLLVVESRVVSGYERSFEQLLEAAPHSEVPCGDRLAVIRQYAQERATASREMVEGLRANDPLRIRKAAQQAQTSSKATRELASAP